MSINVLLKIAQVARKWKKLFYDSDLRWDVHRPQACIRESIRLDTPHRSTHKWGNKIMSYTVEKLFKSLTQESCKETKRRITDQINAGNISKGCGYLRWNDDGGQLGAGVKSVSRYRSK